MNTQRNLNAAKNAKKDEYYTHISDVEKEMIHYKDHFKGKVIYCNCDDPRESAFFKYFSLNFEYLGLKRLIASCYRNTSSDLFSKGDSEKAIWLSYEGDKNGDRVPTADEIGIHTFNGDGDFRSSESIKLMKQADIVITNPPFSLFREYILQLLDYDKKFLIMGNLNAFKYKKIWPYFLDGKAWLGVNGTGKNRWYKMPSHYEDKGPDVMVDELGVKWKKFRNFCWYTNLNHERRCKDIIMYKKYYANPSYYPSYTNADAIEVGSIKDIPDDYYGVMGVPITFIEHHNPSQFEIVDLLVAPVIGDVKKYARILIQRCG